MSKLPEVKDLEIQIPEKINTVRITTNVEFIMLGFSFLTMVLGRFFTALFSLLFFLSTSTSLKGIEKLEQISSKSE